MIIIIIMTRNNLSPNLTHTFPYPQKIEETASHLLQPFCYCRSSKDYIFATMDDENDTMQCKEKRTNNQKKICKRVSIKH